MTDTRGAWQAALDRLRAWFGGQRRGAPAAASAADDLAFLPVVELLGRLGASEAGLTTAEALARRSRHGANVVATQADPGPVWELLNRARNPLNALLALLASIAWLTGDARAAVMILVMILLSVGLTFVQEHRSSRAAARLRALVTSTVLVRRDGVEAGLPLADLVPGDIVILSAGDLVPADIRLLSAKDLHVNQSSLTGEAMPVEKHAEGAATATQAPMDAVNLCFMGSNVASGSAVAVVLRTGAATLFGRLAQDVAGANVETDFDRGITRFTWLMLRFILVLVPAVLLINGIGKGDWVGAFLFAMAVAVGMTPEMLPMIVTVNLARGALAMAERRVIVKRLNAIQNFGAMDVLCTDKTGTLTQDRIILQYHLDFEGEESARVLEYAFLNSHHQSGLRNLLDEAIIAHASRPEHAAIAEGYRKIDEIPFDFQRRRMSVVLGRDDGTHLMICKGAVEEVFAVSDHYQLGDTRGPLDRGHFDDARREMEALNRQGFRVVAVAFRDIDPPRQAYSVADETGLTLLGYVAFLDPPKETAGPALVALREAGVTVKILTGDNEIITRTVCAQVGLETGTVLLGHDIDAMDDAMLADAARRTSVFAKLAPAQKARVIQVLRDHGHVVGYLGDGINDGPALKIADVGISVDSAVDIAKETADIILLEKSLAVLIDGVTEGRRVFGNIVKYIKMGASSNFGNMFSVLGASLFLPFLPMLPIQVLTNNLLYDVSQTAIPTDTVDDEYLTRPRRWDIGNLTRFMLYVGPVSSVFDFVTFAALIYGFDAWDNPSLFQAGWFVESLITQTLIIHIIRTAHVPFVQSVASPALLATTCVVAVAAIAIPYSPLGGALGFSALPWTFLPVLAAILTGYALCAQAMKVWFVRRWGL